MVAQHPQLSRIRKGMELVKVHVVDHAGAMHLTFFNQSYVQRALTAGEEYIFYGAVEEQGSRRTMVNPIFEPAGRQGVTGRIVPVYPLTAGISNHLISSLTHLAVEHCAARMPESLPPKVRLAHQLAQAEFSYQNIHFPATPEDLDKARRRFTFEELFYLSAGLALLRGRRDGAECPPMDPLPKEEFLALLPFAPTQGPEPGDG